MISWWLVSSAGASSFAEVCPEPVPLQRIVDDIAAAEQRYIALEAVPFSDAVDVVVIELPCVVDPVPTNIAARYHVLMGLSWYVRGEIAQARASLAAARAADPSFAVEAALIPEGHELRDWVAPGEVVLVPEAAGAKLLFDGQPATERPTERPTILQLVDEGGRATTCYLQPGDAMPPYPQRVNALPESALGGEPRSTKRWGWLVAGGAGLATSAALYGLAAHSASQFAGPLPDEYGRPELIALRNRTNLLAAGSVLAGSAGVVGMVSFVVIDRPRGGR